MTTGTTSAEEYREALKAVIDPEIFQNIVDLGLVYGVAVTATTTADEEQDEVDDSGVDDGIGDEVTVTLTLTSQHCPLGPQIMQDVQQVLYDRGAAKVTIDLVWQPAWTPDAMTDELKRELGILDQEEEPDLIFELPPSPPQKKGWLSRLFGG